jgi:hypothetical protein
VASPAVSERIDERDCFAILFFAYTGKNAEIAPPRTGLPLESLPDIADLFGVEYFTRQFKNIRESAEAKFSVSSNDRAADVAFRTRCYEWGGVVNIREVHLACSMIDVVAFSTAVQHLARIGIPDYQKTRPFNLDGTMNNGIELLTKLWGQNPVTRLWSGRARSLIVEIRPVGRHPSNEEREEEVSTLALDPFAITGVNLQHWKDKSRYVYLQPFNNWAGCVASEGSALVLDDSRFNREEFREHLTHGYSFVIGEAVAETAAVTDLLCQPPGGRLSSTKEMEKYNELLERRSNDGLTDQIVSVGFRDAFEQALQTELHYERAATLMNARTFLGSARTEKLISNGSIFFALFGVVQTIALFFPVSSTVPRPTAAAISVLPTLLLAAFGIVLMHNRKRNRL